MQCYVTIYGYCSVSWQHYTSHPFDSRAMHQQMSMTYMELGLESCPPSFTVPLLQFLNGTNKSWGWDLGVPTDKGLQNSIMDEHILLLVGTRWRDCHAHTSVMSIYILGIFHSATGRCRTPLMWSQNVWLQSPHSCLYQGHIELPKPLAAH